MQNTILTIRNVSKQFGAVRALDDVSFDVREGEILGLLGANGAGKSTLLKIFGGIQPADEGTILLDGEPYAPRHAFDAKRRKMISVYQELNMFCNTTVAENLFLGNEKRNPAGLIDWKSTNRDADELLRSMGLASICGKDYVGNLSVANRQIVEIARAIKERPRILLLDEPTASLSEDQIKWLFAQVRELAANKTTVIYVSHRLDEVINLCDRCVILRDGRLVATLEKGEITRDAIVHNMVNREIVHERLVCAANGDTPVFSCKDLSLDGAFSNISLEVKSGQILGIAGLVGAGRSELLNAIYGITPVQSGTIAVNGRPVKIRHSSDALANGIVLVSEDRKREGLFLPETTVTNLASSTLGRRTRLGFIDRRKERADALRTAADVCIDPNRLDSPVRLLSGGNQQKVVLGKALLADATVLLLDEPTRGVDVGARSEIYSIIKSMAECGKAVILVSSDWEELTTFADHVVVMSEGRLVGELSGDEITQQNMLHLCTKFKAKPTEACALGVRDRFRNSFSMNSNIWVLTAMLIALMLVGPVVTSFFLNRGNMNNIVWQTFVYFLLTIGQLIVIISGGIDLSISATMTVSSIIGIKMIQAMPDQPLVGMLVMLAFGLLTGAINGGLIVYGNIDAFISTLAVQMILRGIALIITPRPLSPAPDILKQIANKQFLGLPIVLYIGVAIFFIFFAFFNRTRTGRHLYAVGESATGASWLGLRVHRIRMAAYVLSGLMAVMAGYYMLGRSGAAEPTVDTNLALSSIAYALIGGSTLAGGKGSVLGSMLAALVITTLLNIINHIGINVSYQEVIRGVVIMGILILYERRKNTKAVTA